MKKSDKNILVSCSECIFFRRLLTCQTKGLKCSSCKNACCCRKCNPNTSDKKVPYVEKICFSPGMSISDYVQQKKDSVPLNQKGKNASRKTSTPLQEEKDGQFVLTL